MVNKITVFVNRYSGKNPIAQGCISSFCEGLKRLGVRFSVAYEDEYEKNPCDVAVIFGAYKKILKTYGMLVFCVFATKQYLKLIRNAQKIVP